MTARGGPPSWVFIITWPPAAVGGVNEVVFALSDQVRKRGYVPIVAVASWDHQPLPQTVRGVEVISLRLREPFSSVAPHRWLAGAMKTMLPDFRELLTLVRTRNVAVLNPHFPSLGCSLLVGPRRLGLLRVPVVASFHGLDVTEMKETTGMARRLWKTVLRRADRVVVVSAALEKEVSGFAPRARTVVIRNGVSAQMFAAAPQRREGPPMILNIGKFEHKKGQDVLLRVFRKVLDQGTKARLILVGATGPKLEETRALVAELGLEEHVSMYVDVSRDRVAELFRAAEVFVLPSRSEGLPLVLLEAGAAGVAIAATAVGGVPEVVRNEETALLMAPDDPDALQRALQRLLTNPGLRARLSGSMRENVAANWSWDIAGQKYCELLASLRN